MDDLRGRRSYGGRSTDMYISTEFNRASTEIAEHAFSDTCAILEKAPGLISKPRPSNSVMPKLSAAGHVSKLNTTVDKESKTDEKSKTDKKSKTGRRLKTDEKSKTSGGLKFGGGPDRDTGSVSNTDDRWGFISTGSVIIAVVALIAAVLIFILRRRPSGSRYPLGRRELGGACWAGSGSELTELTDSFIFRTNYFN